jgi:hypothetical protein
MLTLVSTGAASSFHGCEMSAHQPRGGRESDEASADRGRGRRASEGQGPTSRQGGAGQGGSGLHGRQYSYFLMRSVLSCFKAALQEGGRQVNGQDANQGARVVEAQVRRDPARASKQGRMVRDEGSGRQGGWKWVPIRR